MTRLPHILLLLLPLLLPPAGRAAPAPEPTFREKMDIIVKEGNRHNANSHRQGIRAMADSLLANLQRESAAGRLTRNDSLEYTADYYKLMGDWYYENSLFEEEQLPLAESYFKKALAIYQAPRSLFRYDLDKIPLIQRELAQLYYRQKLYPQALTQIRSAREAFDQVIRDYLPGDAIWDQWLDVRMQEALCLARTGQSREAEDRAESLLQEFPAGSELYYESARKKAKIILLGGQEGREARALPYYKDYFQWRRADALDRLALMDSTQRMEYWMRMRPFVTDCYQLESQDPGFLYDVALFSKGLLLQLSRMERSQSREEAIRSLRYSWRDIQQQLPADACAIEYIQYEKDNTQKMGAVLVPKKGIPVWVNLPEVESFLNYKIDGRSNSSRLYSTNGKVKTFLYQDKELPNLLWPKELCSAIGSAKKVYFSPDGYIHQLAIEYMLPQALKKKDFYRLSSTRELLVSRSSSLDSALLVGDVKYDGQASSPKKGNDPLAYAYAARQRVHFSPLTHSRQEIMAVRAARSCPADTLLRGTQADEASVRALMPQYPLVFLSTHGVFQEAQIPQGTDLRPCLKDESLSQCYLALAGANLSVSDQSFNPEYLDGVLSAAEIARLDLSAVSLVVISACETGLGKISSDGVFGIQRGFKNAGAHCLLLSLWDVNDEATGLLMTFFQEQLSQGNPPHQAFMEARRKLQQSGSSRKNRRLNPVTLTEEETPGPSFDDPQFYDAFILIDALL